MMTQEKAYRYAQGERGHKNTESFIKNKAFIFFSEYDPSYKQTETLAYHNGSNGRRKNYRGGYKGRKTYHPYSRENRNDNEDKNGDKKKENSKSDESPKRKNESSRGKEKTENNKNNTNNESSTDKIVKLGEVFSEVSSEDSSEAIYYYDEDDEYKDIKVADKSKMILYDSGASTSVVTDRSLLTNFNKRNTKQFKVADESILRSQGSGTLKLNVNCEEIAIPDVSLVPNAALNIISVGQLTEFGYNAYVCNKYLYLLNMNERRCILVAKNIGKKNLYMGPINGEVESDEALEIGFLYMLNVHNLPRVESSNENTLYGQHLAGNHMSLEALKTRIKKKEINVKITPEDVEKIRLCPVCLAVNAIQQSHNKKSQKAAERPLERVHCDTVGPIEIGLVKHYVTLLTDGYSNYIEPIITQTKAIKETTLSLLKLWNSYHSEHKIAHFRSDNAAEMPSTRELLSLGIRRDTIGAYTPALNGTAERANRTIFDAIKRCALSFPGKHKEVLSLFYYICIYCVTTVNHTPKKRFGGLSPYQKFTGIHDYKFNFHTFGVDVIVKCSSKVEANRLGVDLDKATPAVAFGTFLGYGTDSNSYIIMVSTKDYPVIVTSNVTFLRSFAVIHQYFDYYAERHDVMRLDIKELNKFLVKASEKPEHVKMNSVMNIPHTYPNLNEDFEVINDEDSNIRVVRGEVDRDNNPNVLETDKERQCHSRGLDDVIGRDSEHRVDGRSFGMIQGTEDNHREVEDSNKNGRHDQTGNNEITGNLAFESQNIDNTVIKEGQCVDDNENTVVIEGQCVDDSNNVVAIDLVGEDQELENSVKARKSKKKRKKGGKHPDFSNGVKSVRKTLLRGRHHEADTTKARKRKIAEVQEVHEEPVKRSSRGRLIKPKKYLYMMNSFLDEEEDIEPIEPEHLFAVIDRIDHTNQDWINAKEKEIKKFKELKVFKVVKIPEGKKPIPTRWVFTKKEDDLKKEVYKARCVVQGFRQHEGIDFDISKISSPVTDLTTIRLLTAIATEFSFKIHHLDVKSAYLNADLSDDIYVKPPPGYELEEGKCWKLNKSVYGLKQAGYEWFMTFTKIFMKLGFQNIVDTLFLKRNGSDLIITAIYVDDVFIICSNDALFEDFKTKLKNEVDFKDLGEISEYLGVKYEKTKDGYSISQKEFLKKIVDKYCAKDEKKFRLTNGKKYVKSIPIVKDNYKPEDKEEGFFVKNVNGEYLDAECKREYQSIVGSLLWAANNTRPDISYAVNYLGRRASKPTVNDFEKLMYCLRYIKCTLDTKIDYKRESGRPVGKFKLNTFSDASYAPDIERYSISGRVIYLNNYLISWATKRQKTIATSTYASEIVALKATVYESLKLKDVMEKMDFKIDEVIAREDNMAVVKYCKNIHWNHSKKHIDIAYKYLRDLVADGTIILSWVSTKANIADMFTKALGKQDFVNFKNQLFGLSKLHKELEEINFMLDVSVDSVKAVGEILGY
ncbi:uncharacterized protein J8A68_001599 [[Candida] subhashii]|uniref:Integrase catalytic domain-containing protein n=1 Tax=[Candida] subhashii TaxID=561895 RepID=A0A8J5QMS9_9ASCO|nr:uncharacterized protein J8A68_001599 [[Candida] subhashii]KAG7664873.1 hypothetical protein J8A68_001599 [[Candida] subhashii]